MKLEAWLSGGPPPQPGSLRLVCHVSGFYPKPVWVTWVRGEKEQPGAQQGDVMPNADWTWHLRVTLDVAAGEAAGLSCCVKHSSLGDQAIILYWGEEEVGMGGGGPQAQRAVLRKGRDLMDELWREGRRGGRKSDRGRGRKGETKKERQSLRFISGTQCQR